MTWQTRDADPMLFLMLRQCVWYLVSVWCLDPPQFYFRLAVIWPWPFHDRQPSLDCQH